MPGSCKFKLQWLGKDKYKEWLLQGKDVRHAKCRVCQSQFDISSMGEAALTSHAKGQKHQHQLQSFRQTQRTNMTMSSFCRPSTSAAESESSQSSSAASASSSGPGPSQKHGSNSLHLHPQQRSVIPEHINQINLPSTVMRERQRFYRF